MINHPAFRDEPWCLRTTDLDLAVLAQTESLFALANGHIGWRGNLDEGEPHGLPGSYLNGVYELRPLPYAEPGHGYPAAGQAVVNVTNGKLISPARPTHRPGSPRTAARRPDRTPRADPDHRPTRGLRSSALPRPRGPPITSFVCEQEAAPARPTTSGMDNSSAVRGRPWTRVDGSFAPCPLSTSGPALGHEGDLRTRRARHPALEPTMNGAPALATRPTGRELCNYHIPATTPANGHPGPADRRHRPADRRLTDGP